ncbi:binary exotoxin A [Clostridium sp. DL-VIII]|uniref:ADP-ribosyltransferase n=1 Tax=Clostridium sp. DL-VIII TaxID=641107 RepID=UPI00023AF6A7|nr:ADP-ribosyltransferase [Clostridium sp. DL-VIII]EHI97941.1 binary exotoxin A [Clostridium sp. DL-VIII]
MIEGVREAGSKIIKSVSDLDKSQIEALIKYTGDDYVNINNSLRGFETLSADNAEAVDIMKSTLSNASLPEDMILYRGTSIEELGSLKNLPPDELIGKTFTQPSFLSTSTENSVATGTFSGNMQIEIEASQGAHGLDVSSISEYGSDEAEVLFNAGQKMFITDAETKGGILYIKAIIK